MKKSIGVARVNPVSPSFAYQEGHYEGCVRACKLSFKCLHRG